MILGHYYKQQNEKFKAFDSCFPRLLVCVLSMPYSVGKLEAAPKLPIKILPFSLLSFSEENKWKRKQVFLYYERFIGPSG